MSSNLRNVLITGANSGIGLATAQVLASSPAYHIILATRTSEKGSAAADSVRAGNGIQGKVSSVQLDVTDVKSIDAAAKRVESEFGRLDALINNAGVASKAETLKERLETDLGTNVIGAAIVAEAFTPLLLKSKNAYLIHMSSGLGSNTLASDPKHPNYGPDWRSYRMSKAALDMLATQDCKTLGPQGVKVFAMCPGLVESNLRGTEEMQRRAGGYAGSAEVSGRTVLSVLEGQRDADVGKLVHKDGVYPW